MKTLLALSLTTASLLAASTAFAGPNCRGGCDRNRATPPAEVTYPVLAPDAAAEEAKCPRKDKSDDGEGVAVVAQDEEMQEGERPRRGEGAEGERPRRGGEAGERPQRGGGDPLRSVGLSDEQKEQVQEIMAASREEAKAIMEAAKAAVEAGEEVDRAEIRGQMEALREAARKDIYDNVLTDEQRAKMDEIRAEMEKRRAEMEARRAERGEEGERPRRERGGEGEGERPERPRRGGEGNGDLDL